MNINFNDCFPADSQPRKCGCYVRNPSQLNISYARPMVPLRNIDYTLEIVNSLIKITLAQKYYNPSNKYLEVEYSFPINPNSCIYQFSAEFDDVKIEGIVKEKQEAKSQYKQAKSQGRQAVIGTIDPQNKDIMNLQIGNIPPETQFTVNISFMQEMSMSLNTFYKIQIPSSISPRYASDLWTGLQTQKKIDFTWTFKIQLRTTRKCSFYESPSHQLSLISQNQLGTETLLVMTDASKPNKDFTFMYTTDDFHLPSYVMGKTDVSATVMLSFIPKFCSLNINDAYKASVSNKSYETDMNFAKGDYIFLLDRSGSMRGTRIQKAKEALKLFLQSLPSDSYFNVVSFGSQSSKMFQSSQRYTNTTLEKALEKVNMMNADMGGTQIYQPLNQILSEKVNEGYPKHVFLLTDGGVSHTNQVLKLIKIKTKFCRVHSIGIGSGASFELIKGSAQNGKGRYILIQDYQNPSAKIIELLQETLTPLISDISLAYDQGLVQSIVPNPRSIPYILKDDIINFYVTFNQPLQKNTSFVFQYKDSVSKLPYKAQINVKTNQMNEPFIDKMAHLKVIKNLEDAAVDGIQIEDRMLYVKVKDYRKQAIKQSVKHQVLSSYTAFLCVGKKLVDGKLQQYLSKESSKVKIEEPEDIAIDLLGINHVPKSAKKMKEGFKFEWNQSESISFTSSFGIQNQSISMPPQNQSYQLTPPPPPPTFSQSGFNQSQSLSPPGLGLPKQPPPPSLGGSNLAKRLEAPKQSPAILKNSLQPQMQQYQPPNISQSLLDLGQFSSPVQQISSNTNQIDLLGQFVPQQPTIQTSTVNENSKSSSLSPTINLLDFDLSSEISMSNKNSIETKPKISINQVIKRQNIDGSWTDKMLIKELSNNVEKIEAFMKEIKAEILITYLVSIWIEKYYPQKQYSLLVKKAKAYLKLTLEQGIQESKLQELKSYI